MPASEFFYYKNSYILIILLTQRLEYCIINTVRYISLDIYQ